MPLVHLYFNQIMIEWVNSRNAPDLLRDRFVKFFFSYFIPLVYIVLLELKCMFISINFAIMNCVFLRLQWSIIFKWCTHLYAKNILSEILPSGHIVSQSSSQCNRIYLIYLLYTNGKKKECIAKMLITHKICSRWAWKLIKIVSPIHTFSYQTFTRFHVRLVRHLFFLWKQHFMSSATEKQIATKLNDAKRKFMELMIRKPLYFC